MRVIGQTLSLMPAFVKVWLPLAVLLHHVPYVNTEMDELEDVEEYEGLQNKYCLRPNRACVVWQDDPNKTIEANDEDFLLYSSKVAYINGTYELVNSTNRYLPITHSLIGITGSVVITGNDNLEYLDELNALESVEGPSIIRDNKRLKIPVSLFRVLCSHEDSICEVDVYHKGDVNIIAGYSTSFHPRCNIIYGDLVVSGQKEGKNAASVLLSNVHTVYGSVRLNFNEVKNFTFLRNMSQIEYTGDGGTRAFWTKIEEDSVKIQHIKKFCIMKNCREGSNEYYDVGSNDKDKKVFLSLMSGATAETDNVTESVQLPPPAESYFTLKNCLLFGSTVLFLALTFIILTFWTSDYLCRACFYKCVPRRQLLKKKGRESKESGGKSCYVGLANGVSVEGGVEGYVNEYDFSNGAVYATGPVNSDEAPANRSCYLAGQAPKKNDVIPEPVKTSSK